MGKKSILAVSNATDVLVMLVYFTWKWNTDITIKMRKLIYDAVFDINATVLKRVVECEDFLHCMLSLAVTQHIFPSAKEKRWLPHS